MTGAHGKYPEGTIRHISETQAAVYGYSDGAQHHPERYWREYHSGRSVCAMYGEREQQGGRDWGGFKVRRVRNLDPRISDRANLTYLARLSDDDLR